MIKIIFHLFISKIYLHFIIWIYLIDIIHFLGDPYFDKLCYRALYFPILFFLYN